MIRRPPAWRQLRARAGLVRRLHRAGRLVSPRHAIAFGRVPRHVFVPPGCEHLAYEPGAFEVHDDQTMTSAEVVALMTGLLGVRPGARVLEVGTGTGYQAAILAAMGARVTSVEVRAPIHEMAVTNCGRLPWINVDLRLGNGSLGLQATEQFDGTILGCVPETIPQALIDQLAPGGRLVGPEGPVDCVQTLVVLERTPTGIERTEVRTAWFVPMVPASSDD